MDKVQQELAIQQEFVKATLQTLSRLYDVLCDCRSRYQELEDLLDPVFHLEECPYRLKVEPLHIPFE